MTQIWQFSYKHAKIAPLYTMDFIIFHCFFVFFLPFLSCVIAFHLFKCLNCFWYVFISSLPDHFNVGCTGGVHKFVRVCVSARGLKVCKLADSSTAEARGSAAPSH